ncbi:MAG: ATPase, T2SS/T4P/T4SS family [Verrucomicrobiota bacterium]|nr:ATPase, T2SS/T4P/T4SS family [Verrucomicrobiota bacterium]
MFSNDEFMLEQLVGVGMVTEEQAAKALEEAYDQNMEPLDKLVDLKFIDEDELLMFVASEYSMDTFDIDNYKIPPEVVASIPPDVAKRYSVMPVMIHDEMLRVAVADPANLETLDALRYILKKDIEGVIVAKRKIIKSINLHYGSSQESVESFLTDITEGTVEVGELTEQHDEELEGGREDDDAPIIRLVTLIIVECFKTRGSDIHLEPLEKRFRVRNRVDGVLHEVDSPPKYLQNNIISRLKIMAGLSITEKRIPQDGRISVTVIGKAIDLRVSTIPTTHGESIVMRILDKSSIQIGIPELGFFADDQELIDAIISMPDGIFLVTGPTGSGKTTSLYAFLNSINEPTTKIITAEDPVEYDLPGINQVQISNDIGMTFVNALRSMLRQAPNIIMVGEIRDIETGAVAINAALTGHLVFSTLHTNDAPGAVTRMIDMGVKPFLVATAVKAVMAQRLVRKNCKSCKESVKAEPKQLRFLGLPKDYFDSLNLMAGKGCSECNKGFKGRGGIFEIFMVDDSIRDLIYSKASADEIKSKARALGMRTLRDDGLRKAGSGFTTLSEVIRMTASDEDEEE